MPKRPRQFDHEKLDVYQFELQFLGWVTTLLSEVRQCGLPGMREEIDQLDRASPSALLNTAEGNGKRWTKQRARYFDDARGSSTECAAFLDALVVKSAADDERIAPGKELLLSIVSMLSKLVERFDPKTYQDRVKEERGMYLGDFEDEDKEKEKEEDLDES